MTCLLSMIYTNLIYSYINCYGHRWLQEECNILEKSDLLRYGYFLSFFFELL